jgi:hypothetical protein
MARGARIDFPGALHHIMVRGIEGCFIFQDLTDKESILSRMETVLTETQNQTDVGGQLHISQQAVRVLVERGRWVEAEKGVKLV